MSFKPDGYTSVAPYLLVEDAEACLGFLEATFGAPPLRVIRDEDGGIVHAEAMVDDTVVMMGEMADQPGAHVHVYVPDVDACYAHALAAGAESVQPPVRKDDPDRRAGVRDANGTTWWIGTQEEASG